MTLLSGDMDEQILAALAQIFDHDLITAVLGDPLALRTLKQADLQDDPTLTAPYLVYKPFGGEGDGMALMTHEEGKMYGDVEIGGPIRYLYRYECLFGTPEQTTRDGARAAIANLQARVMTCLLNHFDLSGVLAPGLLTSQDQSKQIDGQNTRLITKAGYRIYGGEQTFYGKGRVFWQYPVSWDIFPMG